MQKYFFIAMLVLVGLITESCADPAANKPKADVAPAVPESQAKAAGTESLVISPDNSKVDFVGSKVTRSHNGSFKSFTGTIDLVNNSIEQSRVTIDIDTASIVADEADLTKHLKTPDFFDVAKYPKASFTSTKIEPAGATHKVTGNLDLHGVKKSITFPATIQLAADTVSVNAEFSINRKDFGIVYAGKADDLIRDGVVIKLMLKVPRK